MKKNLAEIVRVYMDWLDEIRGWENEPCGTCGNPKNDHRLRHPFQSKITQAERDKARAELAGYEKELRDLSGHTTSRGKSP